MTRSVDERILRRAALRIGVQLAAAVAVTVLVLSVIAVLVVLHDQHRSQDELISTAIARAEDADDPPAGVWLVIRDGGTQVASPGLPAGLPVGDQMDLTAQDRVERTVDVVRDHREYVVVTRPRGTDGVVQAVLDLRADHAQRSRLLKALLLVGVAGLVLAAGAGGWLGRRAVAPLARALATQRRFVADAGHELRTPLTLLSTRAQLIRRSLRGRAGPASVESDVDELVREAGHLAAILDDLLLSVDPREQSTAEPVDLAALVAQVAESTRPAADEHDVDLTVTMSAAVVLGADAALRRAVTALLDNAVRHARSEIRVSVAPEGPHVVVEVADDGPGIDPDVLPTLFERFATTPADGARTRSRRYGLGLALVSEIAARMGGSVGVVDGDGATFRLVLPARRTKKTPSKSRKAHDRENH